MSFYSGCCQFPYPCNLFNAFASAIKSQGFFEATSFLRLLLLYYRHLLQINDLHFFFFRWRIEFQITIASFAKPLKLHCQSVLNVTHYFKVLFYFCRFPKRLFMLHYRMQQFIFKKIGKIHNGFLHTLFQQCCTRLRNIVH